VVVLFDSGASGGNYVSDAFVSKMELSDLVMKSSGSCRITHGEEVPLIGSVMLRIRFGLEDGTSCEDMCRFEILQGLREELILGVPDILSKFKAVFLEMMILASSDLSFITSLDEKEKDIRDPWSRTLEFAEEEDLIPDVGLSLNFLEMPYEETSRQYLEELPQRIDEEFYESHACPRISVRGGCVCF
jgi:hypothetical protein